MVLRHKWCGSLDSVKTFGLVLALCLTVAAHVSSRAQDQSHFTHFFINPYALNPSFAGFDGQASASLIYRRQWMTIDGAPTITNLSLHAPVNNRVSAGLNINNDSKGFFNNTAVLFSMAYHVPVSVHSSVRFGLSGGGSWNTVDMDKLNAVNDPALATVLNQNASLAGNAGVSFHHHFFTLGASLPALFSPVYVSEDAFTVKEVKPFQALILHASNRFYFNDNKNIFEPYVLYRVNTGLPAQFEAAGILHLNHVVWAGASYKQYFGPTALGGIKLKNLFAIGASYSIQKSGFDELNSPSFEVSLNYLFGPRKRGVPVYSFVNAVRPKERKERGAVAQVATARQKQAAAAQEKKDQAARLKKEREDKLAAEQRAAREKKVAEAKAQATRKAEAEKAKQLAEAEKAEAEELRRVEAEEQRRQDLEAKKKSHAEQQPAGQGRLQEQGVPKGKEALPVAPVAADTKPREEVQEQVRTAGSETHVGEGQAGRDGEQLQHLQAVADSRGLAGGDSSKVAANIRHELVKRGNHRDELPASEYVVVGAFKSTENARDFSDGLRRLNFNTQAGYLTEKALWYVYIFKTASLEEARAQQKRYGKMFLLRDAWLLTVQP